MTQSYSKPRLQAESAFSKVQNPFFSNKEAVEEQDFARLAREAKTSRLRDARLARDAEERSKATSALIRLRSPSS